MTLLIAWMLALTPPVGATEPTALDPLEDLQEATPLPPDLAPPDAVVGGAPAAAGAWPDAAGIIAGGVICTGTLIAPDLVLTADHCMPGISAVVLNAPNTDAIYQTEEQRQLDRVEVIRVVAEYRYPGGIDAIDAAVLVLETPAKWASPRAIARDCITDDYLEAGAPVAIVGYGAIDEAGNTQTTTLHEGISEVQTPDCAEETINGIYTGCNASVSPGGEMGAGGNGVDACFGDSGGPLYLLTPKGDYLIGVTSRAYAGVSAGFPCRDGGIYARADAVVDWIEEVTGRELIHPTCNAPPDPIVEPVTMAPGARRSWTVDPNDPDGGTHSFEILRQPLHGRVQVDEAGRITLQADRNYVGTDGFVLQITDEGTSQWPDSPPAVAEVHIPISVGGCGGCSTGGTPTLWVTLGLLAAGTRRRNPIIRVSTDSD